VDSGFGEEPAHRGEDESDEDEDAAGGPDAGLAGIAAGSLAGGGVGSEHADEVDDVREDEDAEDQQCDADDDEGFAHGGVSWRSPVRGAVQEGLRRSLLDVRPWRERWRETRDTDAATEGPWASAGRVDMPALSSGPARPPFVWLRLPRERRLAAHRDHRQAA